MRCESETGAERQDRDTGGSPRWTVLYTRGWTIGLWHSRNQANGSIK